MKIASDAESNTYAYFDPNHYQNTDKMFSGKNNIIIYNLIVDIYWLYGVTPDFSHLIFNIVRIAKKGIFIFMIKTDVQYILLKFKTSSLLFYLFISDFPTTINTEISLFTDYSTLFLSSDKFENVIKNIQTQLDKVQKWVKK